ncbi:MAG TPA: glycine cleavage system protein GcvH [Candidatus Omnitrophota bacterium]|nr:glycine cleavage system protein GcvH [Candidatus Omnitrophota bacterium]
MNFPKTLRYAKTHEWARRGDGVVVAGLSEYAQKELSDVVYVELPAIGKEVKQGQPCAVVESVKAAFDVYAPVSGKVVKVNKTLEANPSLVNTDSYGEGWFLEIEPSQTGEWDSLLDAGTYESVLQESAH